jgi:heme o synthase
MATTATYSDDHQPAIPLADGALPSAAYADWRDYVTLLKPKVMSLVVFTALCGYWAAPVSVHPFIVFISMLCVAVGAGAAGALNMWWEADTDALMERTANRPIPAGRIARVDALSFAMTLSVGSVLLMGLAVNFLSALILAASILFYVIIYTIWLKRRTAQNIVIGGAAGAFPPMIGWATATNDISTLPILMFALIFFWTPPHFWAMALFSKTDYARAGIPMLPVVAGEKNTRLQVWLYTWPMVIVSLMPWYLGMTTSLYGYAALALGIIFLLGSFQVWRGIDPKAPHKVFGFSILYLFAIFAVLAFDRVTML